MKKIFILVLVLMLCLCQGCAWFQDKEEQTAIELLNEGLTAFKKKKYRQALEAFEKLKDWYPFSEHAVTAELKMGDSYFHLGEYEDAVFMYSEFEKLHPGNASIPYVINQMGLCYFKRLDTIDRDQSSARKALDFFQRLVKQFPGYASDHKATENIKKCRKSLAEHEYYVGMFYFKSKHYKAALHRFKTVIKDYPDCQKLAEARRHSEECKVFLAQKQFEN